MSAGPWVVLEIDARVTVFNGETGDTASVLCESIEQERELAHRIAERLNATEGDER